MLCHSPSNIIFRRLKTTSSQYVAARAIDPTFEQLMDRYKHLFKTQAVTDLVLASPDKKLPITILAAEAQRLHLNRGAIHFVRSFPYVFDLSNDPQTRIRLTASADAAIAAEFASTIVEDAIDRLRRLLSISSSRSLPLRAIFKVWRELGLPDDFENSVVGKNPNLFALRPNPNEANTHFVDLVEPKSESPNFNAAVDEWRRHEQSGSDLVAAELRFSFKQQFPPGMRLKKNFRAKVKEWQMLPYVGPYEDDYAISAQKKRSKAGMKALEKRAVAIAHEFLSLTVEKMVEVEKISHFRKWFGIELNIRDLFLDHPGIFYLSTKGYRHTVFLREAYEKGRLINQNPIYDARMKLLELVLMRRRGIGRVEEVQRRPVRVEEEMKGSEILDFDWEN